MNIASFDIFDTALIRKCGRPENIFWLLADRLFPHDAAKRNAFYRWRCLAETVAVSRKGHGNLSLADFYDCEEANAFSAYTAQQLAEMEKAIERENLMANPAVKQIIAQRRNEGYTICFISDMYLDSAFLAEKLKEEGCLEEGEQVFVSCEENARKSDGKLFAQLRKRLHADKWVHYGDNRHSDYRVARRHGIEAVLVDTHYTDIERRTIARAKETDNSTLSVLASYSRAARLATGDTPFAAIAADYVSPLYVAYTRFVLEDARQRGIKLLYFLSRDSYILLRAAQKMSRDYEDIELKYLFVSRKSLMMPYLADMDSAHFLEAIERNTVMFYKVSTLLSLLQIDSDMLAAHNISFPYKKITTKEQEADFLDKLFHSPLTASLKRMAAEKYTLLVDYFRQEGLLNGQPSAMVDVGWLGTSRLMINAILRREGCHDTHFYYLGIRRDVLPECYGTYISYFPADASFTGSTALIENYFSASPYPTTIGYERNDKGALSPVFQGIIGGNNPIVSANCSAVEFLSEVLRSAKADTATLREWGCLAQSSIRSLKDYVDLTPFTTIGDTNNFEKSSFVKKLTYKELFAVVCLGDVLTQWDEASLLYTAGRKLTPLLIAAKNMSGQLRHFLYEVSKKVRR